MRTSDRVTPWRVPVHRAHGAQPAVAWMSQVLRVVQRLQRVMSRAMSAALQLAGRSMLTALFVTAEVLIHLDLGARTFCRHARALRSAHAGSLRAHTGRLPMIPADHLLVAPSPSARTDRAPSPSRRVAADASRTAAGGLRSVAC